MISIYLFLIFFRLLVVGTIFGIHYDKEKHDLLPLSCNMNQAHMYFIIYLTLLICSLINDAVVAYVSSRGTIFDKESRKKIPLTLYFRALMLVIEAAISIFGTYHVFIASKECFKGYDKILSRLVVIFNIVWVFGCLVIIWFTFDPAGGIWYELDQRSIKKKAKIYQSVQTIDFENKITEKNEKYWTKACQLLFCCTKAENSRDNVLLFASKLFTDYFRSYHDLVPSDILAGMILLRQKQKYEEFKRVQRELRHTDSSYQEVILFLLFCVFFSFFLYYI